MKFKGSMMQEFSLNSCDYVTSSYKIEGRRVPVNIAILNDRANYRTKQYQL